MEISDLRIALFSGNYNYVQDGANRALNRLVEYLLRQGAAVRIYAPTAAEPAFKHIGDLVSIPSFAIPMRREYRCSVGLFRRVRRDLADFAPNIVHVSAPDPAGHQALKWAHARNLPVLASVHTRFDTYLRYYGMAWLEPALTVMLRRFYRRCDALVAPSESMAQVLREERMSYDIDIWSRGVDREVFRPSRRSLEWRRQCGLDDDDVVIGFFGRLVMEKGLDVFASALERLSDMGVAHKVLVIGDGPARGLLEERFPGGVFTGFLTGPELGRAVASLDVLFNPSVTEAFGNVTLEAMASGVPVVAAEATGSDVLVADGTSGRLIRPGAVHQYADALAEYCASADLRKAHGAAGLERSREYSWDAINAVVARAYIRLIRQKFALKA